MGNNSNRSLTGYSSLQPSAFASRRSSIASFNALSKDTRAPMPLALSNLKFLEITRRISRRGSCEHALEAARAGRAGRQRR